MKTSAKHFGPAFWP